MKAITTNYTIKNDDKKLILDSSLESFILTLPDSIGEGFAVELICVGGTESVNSITIQSPKSTILINGDSAFAIDTDRAVVNLALQAIYGKVVHLSCTQGAAGGGGGYTGWSANTQRTELDSNLGLSVSTKNGTYDYISIIDTSAGDVTIDISSLENTVYYIKKFKKVGANKLFLQSFAGFSDFSSLLEVPESCCIVYDPTNPIWEILYNNNNTVTNTIIKSKKITNIDCQTWSAGVEIEPTKPGVIFMPITAFLLTEDNHTDNIQASINKNTSLIQAFYASLITSMSSATNLSFYLKDNSYNVFGDDLYLFGQDFLNPGTVTLYVTYQEITD